MNTLPSKLYTSDQVAELDRIAIQEFDIPGYTLMRRAGQAVFDVLVENYPDVKNLLIVCGAGNNAGDGYVVARLAYQHKIQVTVVSLISTDVLKGDALTAFQQWSECGEVLPFSEKLVAQADVIIDAILGTGLQRDVDGEFKNCINLINDTNKPVIAVDVPSGLNATTGAIAGIAIQTKHSVSFIGLKQGMFTAMGKSCSGEIHYSGLDIPTEIFSKINSNSNLLNASSTLQLPQRDVNTHKNKHGHVLMPGGNTGMPGAVILAARAAFRVGAGLVTVVTLPKHVAAVAAACPEAMVYATSNGELPEVIKSRVTHCAIGPGLGQNAWAQRMLYETMQLNKPMVVDADALNLIAQNNLHISVEHIITPHSGEAARLLGCVSNDIEKDRFKSVQQLVEKTKGVAVLKGAGTLIADEKTLSICPYGNPAMATAGMGDVLTGVIAGLFAQGLTGIQSAKQGVCLHSRAADISTAGDNAGLMATDVIASLRKAAR